MKVKTEIRIAARWLFPVSSPPIENGMLTIDANSYDVIAIGLCNGSSVDIDLGNAAIIPPMQNAHTHLDLTGMAGLNPPSRDYIQWIRNVIRYRITQTPEMRKNAIFSGLKQLERTGVYRAFDIASGVYPSHLSYVEAFYEVLGLKPERQAESIQTYESQEFSEHLAISPHAPFSTGQTLFRYAANRKVKVCSHVGEFAEEADLLEQHEGPFADFLRDIGAWYPSELAPSWDWILETLPEKSLIVHANYLKPEQLKKKNHTVIYCPRTHSAFGHPTHPFREFLAAGIKVILGTDSLASNPDLDIFAEAVHVHRLYPDFPGDELLKMFTWGNLSQSAQNTVAIPLDNRDECDPYRLLFESEEALKLPRKRWSRSKFG